MLATEVATEVAPTAGGLGVCAGVKKNIRVIGGSRLSKSPVQPSRNTPDPRQALSFVGAASAATAESPIATELAPTAGAPGVCAAIKNNIRVLGGIRLSKSPGQPSKNIPDPRPALSFVGAASAATAESPIATELAPPVGSARSLRCY